MPKQEQHWNHFHERMKKILEEAFQTKEPSARKYYDSLTIGKAIWNTYTMELLECHTFKI